MLKFQKLIIAFGVLLLLSVACSKSDEGSGIGGKESAAHSGTKEKRLREYNIEQAERLKHSKNPCDTLSLKQYILENYPAGTLLVQMDRTFSYRIPKEAVIYYRHKGHLYIFALIAKSKPGERNIETKNVVGYESSFINLDSTKLGTAFFFLTLFECSGKTFNKIWEAEVPIHGGFNKMTLKRWRPKNILYVELNYEDGIISGHRNYNFFMVDGITKPPHLLETYIGIAHKRTMANINNDKFPDYYEYRYIDSTYIRQYDSIPFYWDTLKHLYVTKVNRRWFRKY